MRAKCVDVPKQLLELKKDLESERKKRHAAMEELENYKTKYNYFNFVEEYDLYINKKCKNIFRETSKTQRSNSLDEENIVNVKKYIKDAMAENSKAMNAALGLHPTVFLSFVCKINDTKVVTADNV